MADHAGGKAMSNRDPVQIVLAKFPDAKQTGRDQWQARCRAHDDRHASLSIGRGDDGRALVHCQANCDLGDVLAAVGLKPADLFAPKGNGDGKAPAPAARRIVAKYDYTDATGKLLFQTVRYDPKDFRQRQPDGKGGWIWNLGDVPRVLYRLPELLAAHPAAIVWNVEGEKDADALAALGLVATCNPMGAGKWGKLADDSALHGRHVAIIPDRDTPGLAHAPDVASRLHGKAASVKIIALPDGQVDGRPIKDVSDWIESRDSLTPEQKRDALLSMAKAAQEWTPPADPELCSDDPPETPTEISALANEVLNDFLTGKKLPAQPTGLPFIDDHLDPGGLPLGGVFLLAARPNVGKSFIFRWIIEQTLIHDPNARAIIFDAEQDARHIIIQFAARRTGIPSRRFYRHFGNDPDAATQGQLAIQEIGEQFAGRLHLVCDVLTPSLIESTIARVKPTIILIDDLPSVVVDCAGRDSMAVDLARAAWVQRLRRTGPAIGATFHERKDPTGDRLDALFGHSIAAYRADFVLSMSLEGEPGESGAFIVNALCSKNRIGPRGWKTRFAVDAAVARIQVDQ